MKFIKIMLFLSLNLVLEYPPCEKVNQNWNNESYTKFKKSKDNLFFLLIKSISKRLN